MGDGGILGRLLKLHFFVGGGGGVLEISDFFWAGGGER